MSCRQTSFPFRIETARMLPHELAAKATPFETTAGNSSRPAMPRLQTTRNGGFRRMFGCACVRFGFAPYIVHWSAGW